MISEPPVLAPKRTCPAIPPAPWHIGTAPMIGPRRFIIPVEIATFFSVTFRSGNRRLFSSVTAMTALPSVSGTCGSARKIVPIANSCQVMPANANVGSLNSTRIAEICPKSMGSRITAANAPTISSRNITGITRFVSSTIVPNSAAPPSIHSCDIILMPSSMNPKPKPMTMPTATGRLTRSATFFAAPVTPSNSQITPVTMPAPYTALGVIMMVCAACVEATAPIAFIG